MARGPKRAPVVGLRGGGRRQGKVFTWTIGDGGVEGGADDGDVEGFVGRG